MKWAKYKDEVYNMCDMRVNEHKRTGILKETGISEIEYGLFQMSAGHNKDLCELYMKAFENGYREAQRDADQRASEENGFDIGYL